jgi:hypothetical protein
MHAYGALSVMFSMHFTTHYKQQFRSTLATSGFPRITKHPLNRPWKRISAPIRGFENTDHRRPQGLDERFPSKSQFFGGIHVHNRVISPTKIMASGVTRCHQMPNKTLCFHATRVVSKSGWEAWTRTRISRSRICCTANCTTSQHGELRRSAEGITNVAPRQPLPARFERPAQS